MCVVLLTLCVLNIYLSVVYYIQLRNEPGLSGSQGAKGPQGSKGVAGQCSFEKTCDIKDARTKILGIAKDMYGIPIECLDTPTLANCSNNQDTLDQAVPINAQVNMLEQIAYSTTMGEGDFMSKLKVCLQDSNACMDPTDF